MFGARLIFPLLGAKIQYEDRRVRRVRHLIGRLGEEHRERLGVGDRN